MFKSFATSRAVHATDVLCGCVWYFLGLPTLTPVRIHTSEAEVPTYWDGTSAQPEAELPTYPTLLELEFTIESCLKPSNFSRPSPRTTTRAFVRSSATHAHDHRLASSLQHLAHMAPTPPLGPYVGMTDDEMRAVAKGSALSYEVVTTLFVT